MDYVEFDGVVLIWGDYFSDNSYCLEHCLDAGSMVCEGCVCGSCFRPRDGVRIHCVGESSRLRVEVRVNEEGA